MGDGGGSFVGGGEVGDGGRGSVGEGGSGDGGKTSTVGVAVDIPKLQARIGIINKRIQSRFIKLLYLQIILGLFLETV
jgi:hypothetical protein